MVLLTSNWQLPARGRELVLLMPDSVAFSESVPGSLARSRRTVTLEGSCKPCLWLESRAELKTFRAPNAALRCSETQRFVTCFGPKPKGGDNKCRPALRLALIKWRLSRRPAAAPPATGQTWPRILCFQVLHSSSVF